MDEGLIGAWGLSAIGVPTTLLQAFDDDPAPQVAQCIANCLDSPGALRMYQELARPRDLIQRANQREIGVLGIRAVQAGALTDAFDREIPDDNADMDDFRRAEPLSKTRA